MMADHESAIVCDLAQFYHIYNLEDFEVGYIATLVCGLPSESRVMRELSGMKFSLDTMLNAITADYISDLIYVEIKKSTKKAVQRPKSLLEIIRDGTEDTAKQQTFNSVEEFEEARRRIIEEG